MTTYAIAQENGRKGHEVNNLRAEINLGLKKGYGGFKQEKEEVLQFLTERYKTALHEGRNFLPVIVTDSVITYAYSTPAGPVAEHEPSLVLTSDKSPLYASESDQEWQELVEEYAISLAERFDQFRVYVTYTRGEVKIFQRQ